MIVWALGFGGRLPTNAPAPCVTRPMLAQKPTRCLGCRRCIPERGLLATSAGCPRERTEQAGGHSEYHDFNPARHARPAIIFPATDASLTARFVQIATACALGGGRECHCKSATGRLGNHRAPCACHHTVAHTMTRSCVVDRPFPCPPRRHTDSFDRFREYPCIHAGSTRSPQVQRGAHPLLHSAPASPTAFSDRHTSINNGNIKHCRLTVPACAQSPARTQMYTHW